MIAQKLKNGQIAIGNAERKDAIETIYDLRVAEFYRLSKCTRNWNSAITDRRDIMYAYAPEDSKLLKEFDKIYNNRKIVNFAIIYNRSIYAPITTVGFCQHIKGIYANFRNRPRVCLGWLWAYRL